MQCELAVIVYDCVAGIETALITDYNICFLRKHIRYFTFTFVAPVGAYNSFYHIKSPL